jgi:hypothetical protein
VASAPREAAPGDGGSSSAERALKADLAVRARQLDDVKRRQDSLDVELKSALAARKVAEAESQSLRVAMETRRGVNTGAEVTALQARVHGLQDEMSVRERQVQIQVEDAAARTAAADAAMSKLRTELMEVQQRAERALEAERRARQTAELQRDAVQQARNSRSDPGKDWSSGAVDGGGGRAVAVAADADELAKSSSKRGLGASLLKSSSKVKLGKKKKREEPVKSGRASASLSSLPSDDSPSGGGDKRKGRMRMLGSRGE